jgi:hydrogenase maturation protein HypF
MSPETVLSNVCAGTEYGRLHLTIAGMVQGIGFRPFLHHLATELGLTGWVKNSAQGVVLEVEGGQRELETFVHRLQLERPSQASIDSMKRTYHGVAGYQSFEILPSEGAGAKTTRILPDLATCRDCLRDILDPSNRRYRYPFTNCTHCGPRFSIIEALPYDRPNTTMKRFGMCPQCRREYEDPRDRRFHAQPNACPICGPHLELWDKSGRVQAGFEEALTSAANLVRRGATIAVKGLGGFHLLTDARSQDTVNALRRAKRREEKPFALMFPNLEMVTQVCSLSDTEVRLLRSQEAPIVLVRRRQTTSQTVAESVAPGNPYLGVMLPYTPLHHLLVAELNFPVVATSGNLSEEPICTDQHEALDRLAGLADAFLVHDRPIARHVDDSVVRVVAGREMILRRARGYAPLPITLRELVPPLVAVGAHLKNTIAVSVERDVFVSQHIGDLKTSQAFAAFCHVNSVFRQMYDLEPVAVACDLHPDYLSTQHAQKCGEPVVAVQHHYAHVLSCMAENQLDGCLLGVSWDGTGLGLDDSVWGGEFLRVTEYSFHRVAHFRTFPLPGGDRATKEPRRCALGLLYELFGEKLFEPPELAPLKLFSSAELRVLGSMMRKRINSPRTSSVGRLFDAVAAITGFRPVTRFEGQTAMELEFATDQIDSVDSYDLSLSSADGNAPQACSIIDWAPMILGILSDLTQDVSKEVIAVKFHNTLAETIVTVARRIAEERVVLTGGCFQNKYLIERTIERLRSEGHVPVWHRHIPPNDGGIALGQILGAARELTRGQ